MPEAFGGGGGGFKNMSTQSVPKTVSLEALPVQLRRLEGHCLLGCVQFGVLGKKYYLDAYPGAYCHSTVGRGNIRGIFISRIFISHDPLPPN